MIAAPANPSPVSDTASSSTTMTASEDAEDAAAGGRVSRLRQNWAVHEDGALAQRLQSQEIEDHLGGNRRRNHQIRQDFPAAAAEQSIEEHHAEEIYRRHVRRQKEIEKRDAEVARRLAREQDMAEREHREYEAMRDEVFARRLQSLEQSRGRSSGGSSVAPPSQRSLGAVARPPRPEPAGTPPLPVTADGDVPSSHTRETSFHDLRGGLRYNDEQYLVKMAVPAVVKAEPVYANNKPEHYAVSNVAGGEGNGAAAATITSELGAAGLSQKDLVVSKRIEAQLEQEKRDQELARQLQEQLSYTEETEADLKAAREARDLEIARKLHEKEKAKLKRAKERSRLKRLEQARRQTEGALQSGGAVAIEEEQQHPNRSSSRLSRHSDKDQSQMILPARKPYINPSAIENHVSSSSNDKEEEEEEEEEEDEEEEEPQYENLKRRVGDSASESLNKPNQHGSPEKSRSDQPIPPYMPLQQSTSKKSSSLEKRINKKKEKEGCKQQ